MRREWVKVGPKEWALVEYTGKFTTPLVPSAKPREISNRIGVVWYRKRDKKRQMPRAWLAARGWSREVSDNPRFVGSFVTKEEAMAVLLADVRFNQGANQ